MSDERKNKEEGQKEPSGLGEHERGPASEKAHEQGWGLNEDQRTEQPEGRPAHYGGKGFDYGAQDFGDTAGKRDNPEGTDDQEPSRERKAS